MGLLAEAERREEKGVPPGSPPWRDALGVGVPGGVETPAPFSARCSRKKRVEGPQKAPRL